MRRTYFRLILGVSVVFLTGSLPLAAQERGPEISVAWGAMQFDASGTGTVPMVALRGEVPVIGSWLLTEASFSYASLKEQFSELGTRTGIAEGQLQLQLPLARVRPYVGVGAGWAHYFNNAESRAATTATYSAAGGLRLGLSPRFGARAELRLRGWGGAHRDGFGFNASGAEWTAGLTYSL